MAMPPTSVVQQIRITELKGRFGAFGTIRPNLGQTIVKDVVLQNIDLQLAKSELDVSGVTGLEFRNVTINGKTIKILAD
ncbi:hypothetical protein AEYBE204_09930 [Asticcacaulis sp. YBE204]|nr:hypothetical protein AEYBE204_09930 [Asticcacaulis sp. YBE204]